MSGGVAYVLDETGDFAERCNQKMVVLERLEDAAEIEEIRQMIHRHGQYTRSQRAFKVPGALARNDAQICQGDANRLQANAAIHKSALNKPA